MASDPIETAPKNEEWIALLGESGDAFEIARWSVEKGHWVGQDGAPVRITPTHWFRPNPSWLPTAYTSPASPGGRTAPRRKHFGLYAGLLIIAWSAMLEVPWFVGLPSRENFVKFFPTEASVAPQTVAGEHIAGAEMANLYVRTAPESDAVAGDPPHAQTQVEAVTDQVTHATLAGDAASSQEGERRQVDALARDLLALREEIEAIKIRFAAARTAHIEPARSVERTHASPPPESPAARAWYETAMLSALPTRREGSTCWQAGQWPNVEVLDGPWTPPAVQRVN